METTNGDLKLELWAIKPDLYDIERPEKFRKRKEELGNRLESLETEGRISAYNVWEKADKQVSEAYRSSSSGQSKSALERYDEAQEWARNHDYSLEPFFDKRRLSRDQTDPFVFFPNIYLLAYEGIKVQGVFPCSDENTVYEIEDYLVALEEGRDWERYSSGSTLDTPDYGSHGAIKAYIKENLASVLGEEWTEAKDEFLVESELRGRIDLLCRHKDKRRFKLIEVKPAKDKDEIDKAFGQIFRYKHQFLADKNIPGLGADEVELAIAAPGFYKFHSAAAEEASIELLEIS